MINEKEFDSTFQQALSSLDDQPGAADWSFMEKMLTQRGLSSDAEAPVDKVVRPVLSSLEAPYEPAHWRLLALEMAKRARMRRVVWITKFAEAAVLLLLVANLEGIIGMITGSNSTEQFGNQAVAAVVGAEGAKEQSNTKQPSGPVSAKGHTGGFWASSSDNSEVTTAVATLAPVMETGIMVPSTPAGQDASNRTNAPAWDVLNPVPVLANAGPIANAFVPSRNPQSVEIALKSPKQHLFYAGLYGEYEQVTAHPGAQNNTLNSGGGGVLAGRRKGKWSAETGIALASRSFEPKKEVEIYGGNVTTGYYGSYTAEVDASVVSVPVKVMRRLAKAGKWSAHAVAGVTGNFVAKKDYRYETVYYPGISPQPGTNPPGTQPQLQVEGKGLLEGGAFADNFYSTADVGLRIERTMGKNTAIFVEPNYHTALSSRGIGPSPARLSSVSIQAGVLTAL